MLHFDHYDERARPEGCDMKGYDDTRETPDRAEAAAMARKIAERFSCFDTHGPTRRI